MGVPVRDFAEANGLVAPLQRIGSALNLDIHFHMLVPDGVYRKAATDRAMRFVAVTGTEFA